MHETHLGDAAVDVARTLALIGDCSLSIARKFHDGGPRIWQ